MVNAEGFAPFSGADAKILILGSFPSVLSRKNNFYYGNGRNRFWRTLARAFGESEPVTLPDKKAFLIRNGVALWDVVKKCDIDGSLDSAIRNPEIADIPSFLSKTAIQAVFTNGATAYGLLKRAFPEIAKAAIPLPSTSPANTRFDERVWLDALKPFAR